jgi:hexosaminidase
MPRLHSLLHSSLRARTAQWLLASGLALSSIAAAQAGIHLIPAPREAHFGASIDLPARIIVLAPVNSVEDEFAAKDLEEAAAALPPGGRAGLPYRVVLLRESSVEAQAVLRRTNLTFDPAMESEGYVLDIEPREAYVIGSTGSGVFYGVQTLKQLLPLPGTPRVLPTGTIRDWPAMRYRGIDDDLSRGPFPTLDFQKHQIRVFASYKLNIYSPYFEHTLLFPDQPLPAPPGSDLTPAEVAELVAYARPYHVTIIPDQESFGHLHQVLKYDLYQDVAETPHGQVLAPGQPGSLPLIQSWFKQIAQEFPSPFIHIGGDETFDLGFGRTKEDVQQKGYGPVYMAFLTQIHDALAPLDRRLLFWGDIGDENPDAVSALPKDMIAVPWTYGRSPSYDAYITPFAKNGIQTWVAPGVSNWNQVYPDEKTALWNIQGFVRDGQRLGSAGMLNTVWNDDGEGLFNMDWYGVLFGAAAAWQPGESNIATFQDSYAQTFHGDSSGKINAAQKELMAAEEAIEDSKIGLTSDALFWIDPWSPQGQAVSAKLLPNAVSLRTHAEQAIVLIAQARQQNPGLLQQDALTAMDLGARRLDLIGLKFELAGEIVSTYAQLLTIQHDPAQHKYVNTQLSEISSNVGRCQDLRDAFSATREEYSEVWLGENRPYWLNNVTVRYDLAIQQWQRRANAFTAATRGWRDGQDLPAPAALGMPAPPAQPASGH